jgi:hypothetical protein
VFPAKAAIPIFEGTMALGPESIDPSLRAEDFLMNLDSYRIAAEPYYQPLAQEIATFQAAYAERLPVMLKGPTGCGKTRFVEHMAWRLGKPLITVAAHEDMTAADLAGRFLLEPQGTVWHDGPLTLAVRHGAICYLDEIVEARQDTTVVIHPLTDARRILPLEKHNEIVAQNSVLSRSILAIRRRRPKPRSSSARAAPTIIWPESWSRSASVRAICKAMGSTKARPPAC